MKVKMVQEIIYYKDKIVFKWVRVDSRKFNPNVVCLDSNSTLISYYLTNGRYFRNGYNDHNCEQIHFDQPISESNVPKPIRAILGKPVTDLPDYYRKNCLIQEVK